MWGAAPQLSADLPPACHWGALLEEPAWPCGVGGEGQEKPRGAPPVYTHSQPLSSWRAKPGAPSWRCQAAGGSHGIIETALVGHCVGVTRMRTG